MQPLLDKSGHEVNVQLNQSFTNVANVQDLSKHPVYVRTGNGNFYDGIAVPLRTLLGRGAGWWPRLRFQTVRDGRLGERLINQTTGTSHPRIGIAWSPSGRLVNPRRRRHLLFGRK